ncbi:MAG: glycerol-3-phosphate dehydrogenase [Hyphomicrobiales bacterium]|nr:glycerol-3-phosphate dehydrogenase [Hyphomicrobiales bacterium]
MAEKTVDLFVIGGGINGAAIARDAAGRGLSVMLAEKGDYAHATSSASSNLIHGGLRYLESFEFALVRHSLQERESLLQAAPYLVQPLRFLVPLRSGQRRPAWLVHLGLKIYDTLAWDRSLAASGRLSSEEIDALPRLRKDNLSAVLHYSDCRTDDARLVLALLLDARKRGADIANYREVTAINALKNGYRINVTEGGKHTHVKARFVANAAGPWANEINALCDAPPPERGLRLVRGSHIVLAMPEEKQTTGYTLQNDDGRVVFSLPWLGEKYLVIGTTDMPHEGDPATAQCTETEMSYLLAAYNRYFDHPDGPAVRSDIVCTWSGVRPLADDGSGDPSKVTRSSAFTHRPQGTGGFVTVYGGKLTTHRDLAENVMHLFQRMGAHAGNDWTRTAVLPGGHFSLSELKTHAERGPEAIAAATRRRWATTYGDSMMALYEQIAQDPRTAREVVPGIPEAELIHSREQEDATCAEDFLHRRTKLFMELSRGERIAVARWFGA